MGAAVVGRNGRERAVTFGVPGTLLLIAIVGWWWSVRMAADMAGGAGDGMTGMSGMDAMAGAHPLSFAAFLLAWVAMMTAMMFPAVAPVVRLYARASGSGRVAPLPVFVSGYLVVWAAVGVPAYAAWRVLMDPIADARPWAARLAGATLVLAAVWQVSPLKAVCLRHCRSPMSVFLQLRGSLARPLTAVRTGAHHGLYCLGCCWLLMVVLVALGTMNVAWMAMLAALILVEKNAPRGEIVARLAAVPFVVAGVALLVHPPFLTALT